MFFFGTQGDKVALMGAQNKKKYESQRQLERQANILAATREMLAEIGYDRTTIRALAEKAHVAPGTLYNLYNSKDELVIAAVVDLLNILGLAAVQRSEPGLDRIFAVVSEVGNTVESNPAYAEAVTRALLGVQRDTDLTTPMYANNARVAEFELNVAIGLDQVVADIDAGAIGLHLQSQLWGIVVAWIMGQVSIENIQREMKRSVYLTLLGVTTPKGDEYLAQIAQSEQID